MPPPAPPDEAHAEEEEGNHEKEEEATGKRRKSKKPRQASGDAAAADDGGIGDDLLELLGEVAGVQPPSAPSSDEEEEEEMSFEESSCDEEEEEGDGWIDDDVSIISADRQERRYVVGSESFEHIKHVDLRDAYRPKEKKKVRRICGTESNAEKDEYKKLCDKLGVSPCAKFLQNIHNQVMDLSYMGLNQKAVEAICKSLVENTYVKTLILRGNDCGGAAAVALAKLMETNYLINHLNISRTNIIKSMKRLCEAIQPSVTLQVLDISRNDLTDNEMRPLSLVLRDGVLQELYLSRNYIMDEGLLHLSKGLADNQTLEVLDLAYNRLWGGKDSLPFYSAAAQQGVLKRLDLQGNSIKDPAGQAIAKIMNNKKSNLEYLNVSFNLLTHATAPMFGKCFANSKTTDTLIAGPNRWNVGPLTQGYLAPVVTSMTKGSNGVAKLLDLCYITPIHTEFMKPLKKLEKQKPDLKVIHGEPFGFNEGTRPDMHALLIRRAKVICENFETPLSMLINELRTEPETLTAKKFKKFIKSCNLYKDKKMTKEFITNFPAKGGLEVDCKAIIAAFEKEYPEEARRYHGEHDGEDGVGGVTSSAKNMDQLLTW